MPHKNDNVIAMHTSASVRTLMRSPVNTILHAMFIQFLTVGFALLHFCALNAQQIPDTAYNPPVPNPMYPSGQGSRVFVDEGHHNFHTKDNRYVAFARLLERDGYRLSSYEGQFTESGLDSCDILVISNALNAVNETDWVLPTPSAFTDAEITVLRNWVENGGSLFLIADHMPMGGAAKDLAAAFGFGFSNGFVFEQDNRNTTYFSRKDQSLVDSPITKGRNKSEQVDQIATFTGQGFQIPPDATPILVFDDRYVNLLPDTAWVFHENTTRLSAAGWSQGAFALRGSGRVVMFGEAAMFTAQLAGSKKRKVGMNSKEAPQNFQLLLNVIHWLDGKL